MQRELQAALGRNRDPNPTLFLTLTLVLTLSVTLTQAALDASQLAEAAAVRDGEI